MDNVYKTTIVIRKYHEDHKTAPNDGMSTSCNLVKAKTHEKK